MKKIGEGRFGFSPIQFITTPSKERTELSQCETEFINRTKFKAHRKGSFSIDSGLNGIQFPKRPKWTTKPSKKCLACYGGKQGINKVGCVHCAKNVCAVCVMYVPALCYAPPSHPSVLRLSPVCHECLKAVDIQNIWHQHLMAKAGLAGKNREKVDEESTCPCGAARMLLEILADSKKHSNHLRTFSVDMPSFDRLAHYVDDRNAQEPSSEGIVPFLSNQSSGTSAASLLEASRAKEFAHMATAGIKAIIISQEREELDANEKLKLALEKVSVMEKIVIDAAMEMSGVSGRRSPMNTVPFENIASEGLFDSLGLVHKGKNVSERARALEEATKSLSIARQELEKADERAKKAAAASLLGTTSQEVESVQLASSIVDMESQDNNSPYNYRMSLKTTESVSSFFGPTENKKRPLKIRHSINITNIISNDDIWGLSSNENEIASFYPASEFVMEKQKKEIFQIDSIKVQQVSTTNLAESAPCAKDPSNTTGIAVESVFTPKNIDTHFKDFTNLAQEFSENHRHSSNVLEHSLDVVECSSGISLNVVDDLGDKKTNLNDFKVRVDSMMRELFESGIIAVKLARNNGKERIVSLRLTDSSGRCSGLHDSACNGTLDWNLLQLQWGNRKILTREERSIPLKNISDISCSGRIADISSCNRKLKLEFSSELERGAFTDILSRHAAF